MSRKLSLAAVVLLLAGCAAPRVDFGSAPVPLACPALIELDAAHPSRAPFGEPDTLLMLRSWHADAVPYIAGLERQARAREAQIERHNGQVR